MTATAITAPALGESPAAPSARYRIWNVIRLHAANPWTTIFTPWLVLAAAFVLTYLIWRLVALRLDEARSVGDGFTMSGGVTWIVVFMMIVAIQAMNQSFRFAIGHSVTRHDYYLGTVAYFVLLALMFGTGIAMLSGIEDATDGWGLNGAFFAPIVLGDAPLWEVAYVFVMVLLFNFGLGTAFGTVYVRWRTAGVLVFVGLIALLLIAAVWLAIEVDAWDEIGGFFTGHSIAWVVSWLLVPTAISVVAGYFFMRRATPQE